MRIATWNVNSLNARLEKVEWWLDRAKPDILLMQETKLADQDAPLLAFSMAGYDFVHHGEGRWNGVAIATRHGIGMSGPVTNFGLGGVRDSSAGSSTAYNEDDFDPLDEARMLSVFCAGIRFVCVYAPNGRVVGSPFYAGKLRWYARLLQWLRESASPDDDLVIGGDFNLAPTDADVWDAKAVHGGTHV
jgi:exodeoxyribonuclease-3